MKKKHLNLLMKLFEKKKGDFSFDSPYNILIHSVLNNIELNQVIDYYIETGNSHIKNSINSNIGKRLLLTKNPEKLYSNFHGQLEFSNYVKRQRIRNILYTLLSVLPDIYHEDFFNTFYYSKYANDKKSAITIFERISDKRHYQPILNDYFETGNEIYLRALIDDKAVDILSSKIEEIWDSEPRSYLKRNLISLLHDNYSKSLNFLSLKDPNHYLFLQCYTKKFNQKEILKSFSEIPEKQKHFAILNMSKKVSWNILEKEILRYLQ